MIEYTRNCSNPQCKKKLYYSTLKCKKVADKFNRICYSCSQRGKNNNNYGKPCPEHVKKILRKVHSNKIVSIETREKHRLLVLGKNNPMFGRTGPLCPSYGRTVSDKHKKKLRDLKLGKPISKEHRENISKSRFGRKHSEETRLKMRLSKINHIIKKNGSIAPRYNTKACEYFLYMEKERGWNGLYATKNGEFFIKDLGYFVDYYEPNINVIVEYDEPKHYNIDDTLKNRDHIRMMEIVSKLNCKFYRYNERTKEFKQYV